MNFIKTNFIEQHCVVSLNRSEKRNAFHPEMIGEITTVFKELSEREDLRAIILRGEGKSFSAGADLDWMKSMVSYSEQENIVDSNKLFDMFFSIWSCPTPVITTVHGHVMGGAAGLVAVSDIVLAEEGTVFAFSEVKLGLAPSVISPFVLTKMSQALAHRYFLTGEKFDEHAAKEAGLVQFISDSGGIERELELLLQHFYANGPEAVRATKGLLHKRSGDLTQFRDYTSRLIAERRVSKEGQAGLLGFIDKVSVEWRRSWPPKGSN